tara:strand:- start:686 stop:919 length:234 start_codon:yes stop_codon:yes gene_type:complete
MKKFQKLSLEDLISLKARETSKKAIISKGDLVEITYDKKKIIGIIIEEEANSVRVLCENNSNLRWFSKYLNYKILNQ